MRQDHSNRKHKLTVRILTAVVAVLVLFIVFFFVAKPQVENYDSRKQTEGANFVLGTIVNSVQTQGFVGIPISDNQTVNLVPVEACGQIVQQQLLQQQAAAN